MSLVIKRRAGESFHIGNDITVTVIQIIGAQVTIAIEAPKHISIDRHEIRLKKQLNDKENTDDSFNK